MLERFREGDETPAAIEAALGIPAAEFDRRFQQQVDAEFGSILDNLEAWLASQTQMQEAAAASDWEVVKSAAETSIELFPGYVDTGSPYIFLARAEREADKLAEARAALMEYRRLGGYDPGALTQLARWLIDDGDRLAATEVLEAALLVSPFDESVHAELGDLLLDGRPADALVEFEALAELEPHDQAGVNLRLARAHLALGDTDKATEYLLYALEIAPHYREAQQLLLEIVR
jgi:tetratricopeptide (TPR) repeat protein